LSVAGRCAAFEIADRAKSNSQDSKWRSHESARKSHVTGAQ